MGNQLVGIAPSQIFPVEHYLTEHNELQFDTSLGSTRFLKVARAKSQEGLIVVKVFVIHDPTLPLLPHKTRLDEIKNLLVPAVNCLPFQRVVVTEKAGLLMREYVKYSLYDRISTRPFLTDIEKRWIAFQVLYALHQCHKVGVCHGDIKLENITITSWNWVLLTDFASFKPTFLPEDNPADYSYFFDTSRRRTCYIAPERFIKTLTSDNINSTMLLETLHNSSELTPAMDIFSAGCALIELWNEGHAPFDLSQLLGYRTGEYSVSKHLEAIKDLRLRSLFGNMIQHDPTQRLTAELYLSQERGKSFPEYFYTFLQSYMLIFSTTPILPPDEKIARLYKDISNIITILKPGGDENSETDGLVIITSLVTSCVRGLHHCTSKLQCLDILFELASNTSEETILDRILPYILHLAHDHSARVRVSAINTLTQCLSLIKNIPRSDANIFPEYVLPGLASLAVDSSVSVRVAYANNIATLAEIALRYLEQTQTDNDGRVKGMALHGKDAPKINYEIELQTLHEMVQQTVSSLLTDSQTVVKQTLMESGITKLCVFFGKQKANDVLLSHMITFLNDKEDKELRGSFFDCIIGVAAYVGWHSSTILLPLLTQGLTDSSEFVTVKCIHAMSALTELGLLSKSSIYELVEESVCYLVHPSLWIRQAIAGFISIIARTLTILDVHCKIMPLLNIFFKYQLIQVDKPELLLECLVSPIPRIVFDDILHYSDINLVLETLKDRKDAREEASSGHIPQYGEMPSQLKNLFRRLTSEGMTETVEDYLLMMSSHLKKIHKYRSNDSKLQKISDGCIELNSLSHSIQTHVISMSDLHNKSDLLQLNHNRKTRKGLLPSGDITQMNSEWQHMFGTDITTRSAEGAESSPTSTPPETQSLPVPEPISNMSLHERSYVQYQVANCRVELRSLIERQQRRYLEVLRSRDWAEQAAWQPPLPPPGWRLRGSLVAHLHEHQGTITKLESIPDSPLFASASLDGYVRLWDCSKMEGRNIANRSKQMYRVPGNVGLSGLAVCEAGQSLAGATLDGSLVVLRMDPASSRMTLQHTRSVDAEDGCAMEVQYLDSGPQSVLVYTTLYGNVVGWDLRSPDLAWRLENDLKKGMITTFCIDKHNSWLTLGTSQGVYTAWDLRFQLPINTFSNPLDAKVRKIVPHPTENSWIISSVLTNYEVSVWNLETGTRQSVLWASKVPPLTYSQIVNEGALGMYTGCVDRSPFLLAGGTDQRLRFWDLEDTRSSYLAIPAPNDSFNGRKLSYESRVIDGTSVTFERVEEQSRSADKEGKDEIPRAGPEPPAPGHRDWITEVSLCKASQCFLLTASRDGVIKVWK